MINQAHNENGDVSTENRHTINQNRNHTKKKSSGKRQLTKR